MLQPGAAGCPAHADCFGSTVQIARDVPLIAYQFMSLSRKHTDSTVNVMNEQGGDILSLIMT